MNNASDDAAIKRYYDHLFEKASRIVRQEKEHPPILVVLHNSGKTLPILTSEASGDERAALFKAMATHPDVLAVALIMQAWYAEGSKNAEENRELLEFAQERKLCEHPDRKEGIVISIMTATRQAVMLCPIDWMTNTVRKAEFEWTTECRGLFTGRYVRENSTIAH